MLDAAIYRSRVDAVLEHLRRRCLGLDTPFRTVLPDTPGLTDAQAADIISRELTFTLVREHRFSSEDIQTTKEWLFTAIHYVSTNCNKNDRCFASLTTLAAADEEVLPLITEGAPEKPDSLTKERMEAAIISLLATHDLLEQPQSIVKSIEEFSKEMRFSCEI